MIPILRSEHHWVCPNCSVTAVTRRVEPHTEFHHCPSLKGMWAPLVEEGIDCTVVAHEREDYVAGEEVQTDGDGRPIMSVETIRDDGTDLTVYAPVAKVSFG